MVKSQYRIFLVSGFLFLMPHLALGTTKQDLIAAKFEENTYGLISEPTSGDCPKTLDLHYLPIYDQNNNASIRMAFDISPTGLDSNYSYNAHQVFWYFAFMRWVGIDTNWKHTSPTSNIFTDQMRHVPSISSLPAALQVKNDDGKYELSISVIPTPHQHPKLRVEATSNDPNIPAKTCNYQRTKSCKTLPKLFAAWPNSVIHVPLIYDRNSNNLNTTAVGPHIYSQQDPEGGLSLIYAGTPAQSYTISQQDLNIFNQNKNSVVEISSGKLSNNQNPQVFQSRQEGGSGFLVSKPGGRTLVMTNAQNVLKTGALDPENLKDGCDHAFARLDFPNGPMQKCIKPVAAGTAYNFSAYDWIILEFPATLFTNNAPPLMLSKAGLPDPDANKYNRILYHFSDNYVSASKSYIGWNEKNPLLPFHSVFLGSGPILWEFHGGPVVSEQNLVIGLTKFSPRSKSDPTFQNFEAINMKYILEQIQEKYPDVYNELNISP